MVTLNKLNYAVRHENDSKRVAENLTSWGGMFPKSDRRRIFLSRLYDVAVCQYNSLRCRR